MKRHFNTIRNMIHLVRLASGGGVRKTYTSFQHRGFGPDLGRNTWRAWEWADGRGTQWGSVYPTQKEARDNRPTWGKIFRMAWESKGRIARSS